MTVRVSVAMSMSITMIMIVVVTWSLMKNIHHDKVEDKTENGCDEHDLTINNVINENSLSSLYQ